MLNGVQGLVAVAVAAQGAQVPRVVWQGALNYLDTFLFVNHESPLRHVVVVNASSEVSVWARWDLLDGPAHDSRPASQTYWPTFEGVAPADMSVAREVVAALEAFNASYHQGDWRGLATQLYSSDYCDPNLADRNYVARCNFFSKQRRKGGKR